MATILIDTDLDVISKQKELVTEALSSDGVYIRAKETLEDLLSKGEIKGTDRAKVIAETIAGMAAQITSATMSTALQWSLQEKELALKKEELEYQLDILAENKNLAENQADSSKADKQIKQAQLRRIYGTPSIDNNGDVIGLADNGKEYTSIQNIVEDTAGKAQARAKVADDITTSAKNREVLTTQKALYERQIVGFDDNKYQKLFDTQMSAWGLMFSSGMLTTKPEIIDSDSVSDLYNQLTSSL